MSDARGNAGNSRRVCLLTGAGGRLGSAFCIAHAADYDVVAVYRERPPPVASQLQSFLDPLHPEVPPPENAHPVFAVQADLVAPGGVERVVELAMARFGAVDLVVNAAAHAEFGSTLANSEVLDGALHQLAVNTLAPVRLAAEVARQCWRHSPDGNRRRNRSVVNLSSISGVETYAGGQGVYAASKAALNALTRHMALDYAPVGVRVNALAPTGFPRLIPTERVVSRIVQFDRGGATGQVVVLDVDGERVL
ncbi:MAG TPA: SDR family oxidoreductase [Candidatus Dormibacteraeota bacterium]|nr:SDR family oxidoreductase [Candidatus Dormibacteraeota bacterium]